ncbi:MAG: CAP domain-containing protein [Bacillota bacterium]
MKGLAPLRALLPVLSALLLLFTLAGMPAVAAGSSMQACGRHVAWTTLQLWAEEAEMLPVLNAIRTPAQGLECGAASLQSDFYLVGTRAFDGAVLSGDGTRTSGEGTGTSGEGTGTSGEGTGTSGEGTDTSGKGTETSGEGTETSGEGTESSGEGTVAAPAEPVVLTAVEEQILALVNAERTKAGLAPLILDGRLVATARAKSADMVANGYFSHTSPTLGTPFDQFREAGITYQTAAENLAGGSTVEIAFQALMSSPAHRANILNPKHTHIGVGIVSGGRYALTVTQHFIGQ